MTHAAKKGTQTGTYNLDFGKNGKKIPKDIPMFRDLPCNKNIFRAYWVAANYNLMKKQTDFLGAVLLKWLKQGAIAVKKVETGIFGADMLVKINNNGPVTILLEKEA